MRQDRGAMVALSGGRHGEDGAAPGAGRHPRWVTAVARPVLTGLGKLARARRIRAYLKAHSVRKLHLGASTNCLDGWLNTDIFLVPRGRVYLDATHPFPFDDNTFDYVFSEHMIEHIPYDAGRAMLRECRRVLKPNGRVRIATPDLKVLLDLYTPDRSSLQNRYIEWVTDSFMPGLGVYSAAFVINNAFRNWGHQFLYDGRVLESLLVETGFEDVVRVAPGESADEQLRGVESHGKLIGEEDMNAFETMVFEGLCSKRG